MPIQKVYNSKTASFDDKKIEKTEQKGKLKGYEVELKKGSIPAPVKKNLLAAEKQKHSDLHVHHRSKIEHESIDTRSIPKKAAQHKLAGLKDVKSTDVSEKPVTLQNKFETEFKRKYQQDHVLLPKPAKLTREEKSKLTEEQIIKHRDESIAYRNERMAFRNELIQTNRSFPHDQPYIDLTGKRVAITENKIAEWKKTHHNQTPTLLDKVKLQQIAQREVYSAAYHGYPLTDKNGDPVYLKVGGREIKNQKNEPIPLYLVPVLDEKGNHLKDSQGELLFEKDKEDKFIAVPNPVSQGHYNPGAIPFELRKKFMLKEKGLIPENIKTKKDVLNGIRKELDKITVSGLAPSPELDRVLTPQQQKMILEEIEDVLDDYMEVFPEKGIKSAYMLALQLSYIIAYQEYFDKRQFSGSDHGSKHVHHNCEASETMIKALEKGDINKKDRLMVHISHMVHDIGYSVGKAEKGHFATMKDHPFTGARFLEETQHFWETYLDKDCFKVMHDTVLNHAISDPGFEPDKELVGGMHPQMIMSLMTTADGCATTVDRKTAEFWEIPEAFEQVCLLEQFVKQYPQYVPILSSEKFIAALNSPDVPAALREIPQDTRGQRPVYVEYDNTTDTYTGPDAKLVNVFLAIRNNLLNVVKNYKLPENRRDAFQQAITEQFNLITAHVTLGQYGGKLIETTLEKNIDESGKAIKGAAKYKPVFVFRPSIFVSKTLSIFGPEAAAALKKLVEEFNGDAEQVQKAFNLAYETAVKKTNNEEFEEPNIEPIESLYSKFVIQSEWDIDAEIKDPKKKAINDLVCKLEGAFIEINIRQLQAKLFKAMNEARQSKPEPDNETTESFTDILMEITTRLGTLSEKRQTTYSLEKIGNLAGRLTEFIVEPTNLTELEYISLLNDISSALTNEAETKFLSEKLNMDLS